MTTEVQARDALVGLIESKFSTLPRYYEDTVTIDLDAVGAGFVRIEIEFNETYQVTLGRDFIDRTLGLVVVSIFTKDGDGARAALQVRDELKAIVRAAISASEPAGVQLEAARPGDVERKQGWVRRELLIPFWFDSNS